MRGQPETNAPVIALHRDLCRWRRLRHTNLSPAAGICVLSTVESLFECEKRLSSRGPNITSSFHASHTRHV